MDENVVYLDDNDECYKVNLLTMEAVSFKDGKKYTTTKQELKRCKVYRQKKDIIDKYPEYFI